MTEKKRTRVETLLQRIEDHKGAARAKFTTR
jgi:hypothetical protein